MRRCPPEQQTGAMRRCHATHTWSPASWRGREVTRGTLHVPGRTLGAAGAPPSAGQEATGRALADQCLRGHVFPGPHAGGEQLPAGHRTGAPTAFLQSTPQGLPSPQGPSPDASPVGLGFPLGVGATFSPRHTGTCWLPCGDRRAWAPVTQAAPSGATAHRSRERGRGSSRGRAGPGH